MTTFYKSFILAVVLILFTKSERVSYEGYKLYEVYPRNEEQALQLKAHEGTAGIHFLSHVLREGLNHPVNILVSPNTQDQFNNALATKNIGAKIINGNFERSVERERLRSKRAAVPPGEINFNAYHRYDVINDYLRNVATKHSERVTLLNIGDTTEGREILALKISNGEPKPIILIDAGIHAREWIAPAQALYTIHQLVENYNNQNLVQNVDWIIIPLLNPDGYEYTHTTDRLWRKTRSKGLGNCTGTDGNRNFNFHWGEEGSGLNECSETYRGPYAFSEPEIRSYRDLVLKYANEIKLAISFHSFSQLVLHPWSYTTELPSNIAQLDSLGSKVAKAIEKVSGTHYVVGATTHILYYASGNCMDWLMGVAGINFTYTIELSPPNDSAIQFQLPSKYIKKVVSETFEGIKVVHSYVQKMST